MGARASRLQTRRFHPWTLQARGEARPDQSLAAAGTACPRAQRLYAIDGGHRFAPHAAAGVCAGAPAICMHVCLCASLNMPPPLSSAALPRPSPHQHPLLHADVNHDHHSSDPSSTWSPPSPPPSPSSYCRAPSTSSCAVGPGQHRHAACTLPRVRGPSSYCPSRSSALASAPLAPSRSSSCSQAATCTSRFRSDGVASG